jgi:hypothetical protein
MAVGSWSRTREGTALQPLPDLPLSDSCHVVAAAEICVEGIEGRDLSGYEDFC